MKLDKQNKAQIEANVEFKKQIFDREKFVEQFKSVMEMLENFYQNDVLTAK